MVRKELQVSCFYFSIIFLFSFVKTSLLYRHFEKTFQSTIYNDLDELPFYGNSMQKKIVLQSPFVCMAYS